MPLFKVNNNFNTMGINAKAIESISNWMEDENVDRIHEEINEHIMKFATDTDLPIDDETRRFLFKLKCLNQEVIRPLISQS